MEENLLDLLERLEQQKPRDVLFHRRTCYNFAESVKNVDVFYTIAKNYFVDSQGCNGIKVDTIRYWFMHNLLILMEKEVEVGKYGLINKQDNVDEIIMLQNYFKTVYLQKKVENESFVFLPRMRMFGMWTNFSNNEKMQIHQQLFLQMVYLDDLYFSLIHYLKNHNKKFLEKVFKNFTDEKGNNIWMHLIRSANFKNSEQCFRNLSKIWCFFQSIFGNLFLQNLKKKNLKGARPIQYISYTNKKYYRFILSKIQVNFKTFMETIFWQLVRNINRYYQIEAIVEKVALMESDISFLEKMQSYKPLFQKVFERLLDNRSVPYMEKYNIIFNLDQWQLIEYNDSHKEKIGRKLWCELHKDKNNIS